jgi:uncharacterized OsmC-like protein
MTMNIDTTASNVPAAKPRAKREPKPLNGVNVPAVFATLDAVKGTPELAQFCFRAENRWQSGTHSRSTMLTFSGAGGDHDHKATYAYDADHPAALCAEDNGPTPVEFVLHALASCLTAGIASIAAARGVKLSRVSSKLEGDINLLGVLGLDPGVRNGYEKIRVSFEIDGDAPRDKLEAIVEQSRKRSAVFDIVTGQVPVEIDCTVA